MSAVSATEVFADHTPIGFGRAILGKNSSDFKRRDAESVVL